MSKWISIVKKKYCDTPQLTTDNTDNRLDFGGKSSKKGTDITDKTDNRNRLSVMSVVSAGDSAKKNTDDHLDDVLFLPDEDGPATGESDPPFLGHLNDLERDLCQRSIKAMTELEGKDQETAIRETTKLLLEHHRVLKFQQATKDLKMDGYLKLYSTVLDQAFYLVRDQTAAEKVPDKSLKFFTIKELQLLKGHSEKEKMLLIKAKIIFNSVIKEKKTNG